MNFDNQSTIFYPDETSSVDQDNSIYGDKDYYFTMYENKSILFIVVGDILYCRKSDIFRYLPKIKSLSIKTILKEYKEYKDYDGTVLDFFSPSDTFVKVSNIKSSKHINAMNADFVHYLNDYKNHKRIYIDQYTDHINGKRINSFMINDERYFNAKDVIRYFGCKISTNIFMTREYYSDCFLIKEAIETSKDSLNIFLTTEPDKTIYINKKGIDIMIDKYKIKDIDFHFKEFISKTLVENDAGLEIEKVIPKSVPNTMEEKCISIRYIESFDQSKPMVYILRIVDDIYAHGIAVNGEEMLEKYYGHMIFGKVMQIFSCDNMDQCNRLSPFISSKIRKIRM
jgi:hypothetical protein